MTYLSRLLAAGAVAMAALPAAAQDAEGTRACGVYVFFNSGQAEVDPAGRDVLIEYARTNPGARLTVTGYSDAAGNAAANQALSLRRAQSVASALSGTTILAVTGAGEAVRPGTSGPNDPSNRRVEALREDCGGVPGPATANAGVVAGVGIGAIAVGAALAGDDDDGVSSPGTTTGTQ
ncbi:OmpA family protein [Roseivivax sediminis]|uniref:OmpA family protein n=1 Tax=Roseivivax sediminis TaxID=936889 RepID=A0A1I1UW19_9RHOB|nr:OmpA family protein [Roseivivax sediminis]SFD73043.1 OmpA family protein [Roseivivax sediminis]